MVSQAEAEIKLKIRALVDGELSLADFQSWFVPATWGIESEFASEVELRLAEASSGHWSEDETKDLLANLVDKSMVTNRRLG
jgi:hypothetical protein